MPKYMQPLIANLPTSVVAGHIHTGMHFGNIIHI